MRTILGSILSAVGLAGLGVVVSLGPPGPAADAHTDASLVAVPAGGQATVMLEPTHGCDESPTVEVAIRAPVAGATAGDVDGWTATVRPDEDGRTVLEWKGGSLPADQEGAFPVTFTAPDTPGELLTFPAVQTCENGEELSWISGNPKDEYPAPRILVLPKGAEPAGSLDEVPADAPGRDKLAAVVDTDNPSGTTTTKAPETTVAPGDTSGDAVPPSTTEATATDDTGASTTGATATDDTAGDATGDDDGGSSPLPLIGGGLAVVLAGSLGARYLIMKRRD